MEEKRLRRRAQLGQSPSGPGISGIGQGPVVPEQPQLQQSGQQSDGSQQIPSRNALQELISALRRNNIPTASKTSQEEPKEKGIKCTICFEPPEPMFMFLNCGHLPFCDQCSAKIMKERKICPICREFVSKRQRAYFQQA